MNAYRQFVSEFAGLLRRGKDLPLGGFAASPQPALPAHAPKALLFSPHPDDEVIVGALPLRLLRELQFNVLNVAVTQGSHKARQAERWKELAACCESIGFGLVPTRENGLEGIHLKTRREQPLAWAAAVECIARLLADHQPRVIFFPHERDWNSTHIGTHLLVLDALTQLGRGFECFTVETEFWGPMDAPNLMVESSERDVADLLTALSFHVGEVRRNPYHVRMPAWLIDNVRRGGELVGGQGGAAPDFTFATLYRLRRWQSGQMQAVWDKGRFLSQSESPNLLFPR
jgi:LmbE family N-acetylglucosaminyl deacetylase